MVRCERPLRCHHKAGFTLTEILVVLALIVILSLVLMPAIMGVREQGRRVTCAAKLMQLGFAISLYNQDYSGLFPSVFPPSPHCTWVDRLQSYAPQAGAFECPSNPRGEYRSGCPTPQGFGADALDYHGSYALNWLGSPSHVHVRDLTHPAGTILVVDSDTISNRSINPANAAITDTQYLQTHGVLARHGSGDNVLFADRHVRWLRLEAMLDRNLWWSGAPSAPTGTS